MFHALADPTRRAMLRSLSDGERNIGELAAPFAMSFAAASKHVRVLENAGLLQRRVEGRSPDGFTLAFHEIDLQPGGKWRIGMRAADGELHVSAGLMSANG